MKNIKFVTTFSKSGYHVYGKTWIESFLNKTKDYPNITANIYVDNMSVDNFNFDKISVAEYHQSIPEYNHWLEVFKEQSRHDPWNRDLAIKFAFKSFVMLTELKKTSDGYVVWLDADCVFLSDDFDNWPEQLLGNNFIACQREHGSEHVESGIIIFDSAHSDKQTYINKFESLYMLPAEFNNFGQFFDGFAVGRTLNTTGVPYVDLNKDHGLGGIQSDPNHTFLNPEIRKRFIHNIGITGKRQYEDWEQYKHDPFFQLIHGVNDLSPEVKRQQAIDKANSKIKKLRR
jgi:hypothetical protein